MNGWALYLSSYYYIWLADCVTRPPPWSALLYLRYRVIKADEGTGDNGDVHHVPEVPHVGSGVENKTLVKNLKELFFFNEAVSASLAPAGRSECL